MDVYPIELTFRLPDTYPMNDRELEQVHADEYYSAGFEMIELLEACALRPLDDAIEHERQFAEDLGVEIVGLESTVESVIAVWEFNACDLEFLTVEDWRTLAGWRRELLVRS